MKLGIVLVLLASCLPLQAKDINALSVEQSANEIKDKTTNVARITIRNFKGEPNWRRPLKRLQGQLLSQSGNVTGLVVLGEDYSEISSDGKGRNSHCGDQFPKGTFDGEIVICQQSALLPKAIAENLKDAGAGGMILQATQLGHPIYQRFESLPSVSLTLDSYFLLKNWVKYSKPGTTRATISE